MGDRWGGASLELTDTAVGDRHVQLHVDLGWIDRGDINIETCSIVADFIGS